jgi:hypothetical protein
MVYVQIFDSGRWQTPLNAALCRFEFPLTQQLRDKIAGAERLARLVWSDTDEVVS